MSNASHKETTLEIEISRDGASLRVGLIRRTFEDKETLRHYEERSYDAGRIAAKCADIVRILNNANVRSSLAAENFHQLKQAGFFLFEELLSPAAQRELNTGDCDNLIINIDDGLVHIPWELLYDGNNFICKKFNVGRVVRTRQPFTRLQPRIIAAPLEMLIICDPCGDLDKAYEEGDRIRSELDRRSVIIRADLFNGAVDTVTLKEYLRSYDIIHYAGHADYDPDNPAESGWLMHDSKFTARDISQLSPHLPLPALVFSNACQSGQTGEWRINEGFEHNIFGLANAFLLAGVRHYVGTFWEVLDESSCEFSTAFYRNLIQGEPIGSALRKAREHLITRYGEEHIVWASYMLYGNPASRYIVPLENGLPAATGSALNARDLPAQGAGVFPSGATRALPPDRRVFNFLTLSLIAVIIALAVIFLLIKDQTPLSTANNKTVEPPAVVAERKTTEEIQAILKRFSQKYAEQKKPIKESASVDAWTSHMLTLSLLGLSCIGDCTRAQETEQYVIAQLSKALTKDGRVSLVEREKILQILNELQLSSSDVADQELAPVLFGKLLGARLICAGKIVAIKGDHSLNLRVFETDTSRIIISIVEPYNDANKAAAIERAAQSLVREIKSLYPVQGKIARIKPDEITLNIGSAAGVTPGSVFAVLVDTEPVQMEGKPLGYDEKKIGSIRTETVKPNFSRCSIVKQESPFKEGARVVEMNE
jgi:CHAT domain-containing protein